MGSLISCSSYLQDIYLGQGVMAGEAKSTSIILQSRLTSSRAMINNDLLGKSGVGRFEIDTDSTFGTSFYSEFLKALPENDFIIKKKIKNLKPGIKYYYRLHFGIKTSSLFKSHIASFKTLVGSSKKARTSLVVVTGMNYYKHHFGQYDITTAYSGKDKNLGYPALKAIQDVSPDYFIGTGDNVYFDHPRKPNFNAALRNGKKVEKGGHDGKEVLDEKGMRRKYHEQFAQQRFIELFSNVGTYWEKDDHDYRFNDADPYQEYPITHDLGMKNFKEQLPIVDPNNINAKTYRTHRMSKDLQVWFLEGRDYRSPNSMEDGPNKSLLGKEQLHWLKTTLLQSDASFKIVISPTPMVGPDDMYKSDNHVNIKGFRHEGEAFFKWLVENQFLDKNLYIICGDRHWQYHAKHPTGIEEFSTGTLSDNNARAGRIAGDSKSTDPNGLIKQYYIQGTKESASGGFLSLVVDRNEGIPTASFKFYDEKGEVLYTIDKKAQ